MVKITCTIFFFVFMNLKSVAQLSSLSGTLSNIETKAVISANISIQQRGSQEVLTRTLSDEHGRFKVVLKPGKYLIIISAVGYADWQKQLDISGDTDLQSIVLQNSTKLLKEVKINQLQSLLSKKTDRLILNIENSVLASGKSAIQLFTLAPGVWVDQNTNISINGVSGTKVMVDGKLLYLAAEQLNSYLSSLRAEEISSIEIIAHPPAEYDAEGAGGLINIILKRQKNNGLYATFNTSTTLGRELSFLEGTQLNYKAGALVLFADYNHSTSRNFTQVRDKRRQDNYLYQSVSVLRSRGYTQRSRIGAQYKISASHTLGVELSNSSRNNTVYTNTNSIIAAHEGFHGNLIDGNFSTMSRNRFKNINLDYQWKTDTIGSSLRLLAGYIRNDNFSKADFNSAYKDLDNNFLRDSIYRNTIPNLISNIAVQTDYTRVFSKKTSLIFGSKYTSTSTKNEILYESLEDGQYYKNPNQSNLFNYNEKIYAGYFKVNLEVFKTQINAGLRLEHTDSRGRSVTLNTENQRGYFNLFPSILLRKVLGGETANALSMYIGRRVSRPSFADLNPFILKLDDYTSVTGNPALKPQYTNALEATYTLQDKYIFSVYSNHTTDVFVQQLVSNEDKLSAIYQRRNLDLLNNYGATINAPFNVTKWWTASNSLVVYKNNYKFSEDENSLATLLFKTLQDIQIGGGVKLQTLFSYKTASNQGNLVFKPNYYFDFGVQKSVFKDQFKLDFLIMDLFNTSRADYSSDYNGLYVYERQKYQTQKFSLSISYDFSIGKRFRSQKTEYGNQEEKSRVGNQ
jgi:iron complex outermembrane receptor protein